MPEIAAALQEAVLLNNYPHRTAIVFKAFHETVDSFGAFPYAAEPFGHGRLAQLTGHLADPVKDEVQRLGSCTGCHQAPWTGAVQLKQSGVAFAVAQQAGNAAVNVNVNVNAPPDALGLVADGVDRKLRTMKQLLEANGHAKHGGRVIVCGLALDFCVLGAFHMPIRS